MDNKENKKKTSTVDEKASGRRKLLKSVVAGGGAVTVAKVLPDQWARPVVDSVMLPSHAETSGARAFGPFVNSGGVAQLDGQAEQLAEQGFSEELMEFFTPAASAGIMASEGMSLTANESGDSFLCSDFNSSTYIATVQIQNTKPPSFDAECFFGPDMMVSGGTYVEGTGWRVSVMSYISNGSTTVDLTPGGPGCTDGNPAKCKR